MLQVEQQSLNAAATNELGKHSTLSPGMRQQRDAV